jgi:hypothetical protein
MRSQTDGVHVQEHVPCDKTVYLALHDGSYSRLDDLVTTLPSPCTSGDTGQKCEYAAIKLDCAACKATAA